MASERAEQYWNSFEAHDLATPNQRVLRAYDAAYDAAVTKTRATTLVAAAELLESCAKDHDKDISEVGLVNSGTLRNIKRKILALADADARELMAAHDAQKDELIFQLVRELAYCHSAENISQVSSGLGESLVERGMDSLGINSLQKETLKEARAALGGE